MHQPYFYLLGMGHLDDAWFMGVQINSPKGCFKDAITEKRPLKIVNLIFRWISTILLLRLEGVLGQLIPP